MADQQVRPLTGIQRNNRIFACIWLFFEVFFCVMYGVYGRTVASNIFTTFGLFQYIAPVGIAIATVIGLGCIMSFVSGLKWSGVGFAFLILALCYQYYFLINAFWTKADIQNTTQNYNGTTGPYQDYGDKFLIYLSEAPGILNKTFGCTATGAFKLALTIAIAFSAVVGRAGPLEILFFVFIGGFLYELNRQIISYVSYDVGGSTTIFMFGGIMGTVVALLLTLTKQKNDVVGRQNYTSSRFNATIGLLGAAFFWVFYPTIFLDLPLAVSTATQGPFMATNAMIIAYYAISATVVTSAALSAVINGRIRIKDLMYAPFAGAAIIGTSAVQITNPIAAILLGMIAGLLQPLFNIVE